VQRNGSTVANYAYNALGQRIAKAVNYPQALSQRFVYDNNSQLIGEYDDTTRDYLWVGDLPIAVVDTAGTASTVNYITADALGTPRVVTNGSGTTVWSWSYQSNPFGEQQPTSSTGYVFNLRFPGQYYDAESGLAYNLNRDYEAVTGRYVQSDPLGLGGGASTYGYVGGSPLSYLDPFGLKYAESWAAGGAVTGGVVTAGASVAVDAFTGGLNVLATGPEIAGGAAIGGGIGYLLGSAADWVTGNSANGVHSDALPPGYWPADTGAEEWGRRTGVGAKEGKGRFHGIKQSCPGSKATDVFGVNPSTGDVIDPEGEVVGNLEDVKSK